MVVYNISSHSVEVVENSILGVLDWVTVKGEDEMPRVIGTLDDLHPVSSRKHIGITISLLVPVKVIGYLETVVVFLIAVDNVIEDG